MMPPVMELVPYVMASAQTINLGGFEGGQRNWQELGGWIYRMQEGRQELTEQEVEQARRLTSALKVQPDHVKTASVRDNFADYPLYGKVYVPRMDIAFSFDTGAYGTVSGTRLFVPVNPVGRILPVQKSARVNELYGEKGGRLEDNIVLHLPQGFRPEGIPEDFSISSCFGSFVSRVRVSADGATIEVYQSLELLPFRVPAAEYSAYRDFARAVNRAYSATLVLAHTSQEQ